MERRATSSMVVGSSLMPKCALVISCLVYLSLLWFKQADLDMPSDYSWAAADAGMIFALIASLAVCISCGRIESDKRIPSTRQDTFSIAYALILNATSLCLVAAVTSMFIWNDGKDQLALAVLQTGIMAACLINLVRLRLGCFVQRERMAVPSNRKSISDICAYLNLFSLQTDAGLHHPERLETAARFLSNLHIQNPSLEDHNFLNAISQEVESAYLALTDCNRSAFQTAIDEITATISDYQLIHQEIKNSWPAM